MRFITLISDWQNDDFYVAAIKGLLYSECKAINVVDITHKIDSYKYTQAAFVLKNAFNHFPEGTIHIVAVNSDITTNQQAICIQCKGHYFIGSNNGIFALMFSEQPDVVVQIAETNNLKTSSFPELTIFARAAAHLANNGSITELGKAYTNKQRNIHLMPTIDETIITGSVIYFDSYKNVFTNINRQLFDEVGKGRTFTMSVKSDAYRINKISNNYSDVEIGEILAVFNTLDLLEIAMRNVRMAELLDIRLNSPVIIKFI